MNMSTVLKKENATMFFLTKPSLVRVLKSVCVSVSVSFFVHDNSKNNGSIHLKSEHIVIDGNSSEEFDIGHCLNQSQGHSVTLKIFLHLPQYKLSSPISQLCHMLGSCD